MTARNIMIIGAGIGGLSTALAFARLGHEVDILERAPVLSEVGAGLQISPNASRILIGLGLGDALAATMIVPHEIVLASGRSLRKITHVPCGGFAAERWGAPYGVMHRADLQQLLLDGVTAHPRCRLHLGQSVSPSEIAGLHERIGRPRPDLVVGADGVWSQVRSMIGGARRPRFSGKVAWRFRMDTDRVRSAVSPVNVTAFLGPDTHLVTYPLDSGKSINLVAISDGDNPGETWEARETDKGRGELLDAFSGWHRDLVSILEQAPRMTRWPLFEVPDGPWHNADRTVLIGDAAHAMTPFAAQGAAMAIEDGFELAQAFDSTTTGVTAALQRYEEHRRARIGRARNRGAFNRFAYHARGPIRIGRDFVLSMKTPESLAADLDWLYGYRSPGL